MKLILNRENIDLIEKEAGAPAISIYMPLAKTLSGRKKNRISFENSLKSAARQIIKAGSDKNFARQFVEPGFALAQDHFFWKTKAAGLAIFITAPQILRYFELPAAPKESTYVGKGFDTARLKKIFENARGFYFLVMSKNSLFFCDFKNGLARETKLRGLRQNIKDFLPGRDPEKTLQSHGRAPVGKREIFHGHGKGKDSQKELLLKYFKIANKIIQRYLAKKNAALVFAGTDEIFSIYRQANTYPHFFKKNLKGNFENFQPQEIAKRIQLLLG